MSDTNRLSQHVVEAGGGTPAKTRVRGVVPKVVHLYLKYTWDLYSSSH